MKTIPIQYETKNVSKEIQTNLQSVINKMEKRAKIKWENNDKNFIASLPFMSKLLNEHFAVVPRCCDVNPYREKLAIISASDIYYKNQLYSFNPTSSEVTPYLHIEEVKRPWYKKLFSNKEKPQFDIDSALIQVGLLLELLEKNFDNSEIVEHISTKMEGNIHKDSQLDK